MPNTMISVSSPSSEKKKALSSTSEARKREALSLRVIQNISAIVVRLSANADGGERAGTALFAVSVRSTGRVYARHGRELMGCKSPVGEPTPMHLVATTSLRQGRLREAASGG